MCRVIGACRGAADPPPIPPPLPPGGVSRLTRAFFPGTARRVAVGLACAVSGLRLLKAGPSVTPRATILYSTLTPKLRIQGENFGNFGPEAVELEFVPPLTGRPAGGDGDAPGVRGAKVPIYEMNVTDQALVLGLKKGFSWPIFESSGVDGTTVFLNSIKVKGGANLLEGPVPVAKVIPPPTVVKGEDKIIYTTGTKKFLINGTGFREGMSLFFSPPLAKDVDYRAGKG